MVRLIISLCLFAVYFSLNAEDRLLQDDYRGEAKIVQNYAQAIANYYNLNSKMPRSLLDIRDNTILSVDFGSRHAATVPSRYALLETPLEIKGYGKAVMVSVDCFVSSEDIKDNGTGGRMVALLNVDGSGGSARIPASAIDPVLKAAGVALKPIGGEVPAPTFPLPSREPGVSEEMKRALEMKARGELPTPKRRDKETWRDEKPIALPASTLPPAPVTPPPAKSSNLRWWIIGIALVLTAMILVARKKKPKS